ncbi:hypothetical protein AB6806_23785 [Bosea sp. RCC_152_1]|uniref:hypothetical protein n=1 Tax=Bosea sp. RCC_152_1 TaxID=3239228 RepID=UPI0035258B95
MNIADIPGAWLTILAAVQTIHPEAILAGGALRDLDNGRPVKDLDIFIDAGRVSVGALSVLLGIDPTTVHVQGCDFSSCLNESDCQFSDTFSCLGWEVNVIGLADMPVTLASVTERVDFGICQIGTDGVEVRKTLAYHNDKAFRRFTVCRQQSVDETDRSLRRWDRISAKYPGWTLVRPALPTTEDFI